MHNNDYSRVHNNVTPSYIHVCAAVILIGLHTITLHTTVALASSEEPWKYYNVMCNGHTYSAQLYCQRQLLNQILLLWPQQRLS